MIIESAQQIRKPSRRWAILHQRCPRCRRGLVFRGRFAMNNQCPACALRFEREPGYFVGAMYISYAIAVVLIGGFTLLTGIFLPEWPLYGLLGIAVAAFLPFVPALFRYSRIIWMHIDRAIDP